MPTTQQQIENNIAALDIPLDNPSMAAIFDQIAQAIGVPIDNTLTELTNNQNTLLAIVNDKNYGRDEYYTDFAKAFQLGDDLLIDPATKNFYYPVIDVTKQIVAQAAFQDDGLGQLFIKIAKLDAVSGLLEPLDNDELSSFSPYFQSCEIPGLPVGIINNQANILAFNAIATFFKTYNKTNLQGLLATALNTFRSTFAFNGEFFDGDLEDYIKQTVPGIRNFYVFNTTIDGSGFSGFQSLSSGYFNYINTILDNITYNAV